MTESAINVAARLRPVLKGEEEVSSDQIELSEEDKFFAVKNNIFYFDSVFPPHLSNEEVYNKLVAEKIPHILEGYNVTILAYGPTGSGKSFTMGATSKDQIKKSSACDIGLIPRGLQDIFNSVKTISDVTDVSIKASFIELYMEELHDLMQKPDCNICTLRGEGDDIKISNLSEKIINSVDEAIDMLETGICARHTEVTAKNSASSRSHAIFCVTVTLTDKSSGQSKRAKFQLVDLAGSERPKTSKTEGEKFKQGININKALMTLGRVINSLVKKEKHIPFRDSTLTRLLQDSFGGNSHTVMIACVNPSQSSIEETLSTLRYASSARSIRNRPIINKDNKEEILQTLKRKIAFLERELASYRCSADNKNGPLPLDFFKMNGQLSMVKGVLCQADDKLNTLFEKLKEVENNIKELVSNLTVESIMNDHIKEYLSKLESIAENVSELMLKVEQLRQTLEAAQQKELNLTTKEYKDAQEQQQQQITERQNAISQICKELTVPVGQDNPNSSHTSMLPEGTLPSSEGDHVFVETSNEDIENPRKQQIANVKKLEEVELTIKQKQTQMREYVDMEDIVDFHYNEETYNELFVKIETLTIEKRTLMKEQEISKEKIIGSEERVKALETEIQKLHIAVERNKKALQLKKDHKAIEVTLQREIEALKKVKVQLIKQIKGESDKHLQQKRESDKKVARLEKQSRQADAKVVRMKNFFEAKVNVLQRKVDDARISLKAATQAFKQKTKFTVSKRNSLRTVVENYVDELLKENIGTEKIKAQIESYEKYANGLQQNLKELKGVCEEKSMSEEEKALYSDLQDKLCGKISSVLKEIDELRKKIPIESNQEKQSPQWSSINSVPEAIIALKHMSNRCVSSEVENLKKREELDDELKKKDIGYHEICEVNFALREDIAELEKTHERKLSCLNEEWESKLLTALEKANNISTIKIDEGNLSMLKDLQLMEKELLEKRLQNQRYEEKCEEIKKLKEELNYPKTKKKIMPSYSPQIEKIVEQECMMDEFLKEDELPVPESEASDPDWRATPLYKRRKCPLKRKSAEKDEDFSSSPKRQRIGCNCPSHCKTMRCACRKRQQDCTADCNCDKHGCMNIASSSLKLSF